jgi:hypothetical protein
LFDEQRILCTTIAICHKPFPPSQWWTPANTYISYASTLPSPPSLSEACNFRYSRCRLYASRPNTSRGHHFVFHPLLRINFNSNLLVIRYWWAWYDGITRVIQIKLDLAGLPLEMAQIPVGTQESQHGTYFHNQLWHLRLISTLTPGREKGRGSVGHSTAPSVNHSPPCSVHCPLCLSPIIEGGVIVGTSFVKVGRKETLYPPRLRWGAQCPTS